MFHLADKTTAWIKPGDPANWNMLPATLRFIASNVHPGQRTLEIGSGASTLVFAAAGAEHTAISPVSYEHDRIREYADQIGVDLSTTTFIADFSDNVVPHLDQPLDAALIDGSHAFPWAVVEWHFLRKLLKPGGLLLLDDVPIPAVTPVYRYVHAEPDWALVRLLDRRTAAFHKIRETPLTQTWRQQGMNASAPDYSFLPARDRLIARSKYTAKIARSALGDRVPALRQLKRRLKALQTTDRRSARS